MRTWLLYFEGFTLTVRPAAVKTTLLGMPMHWLLPGQPPLNRFIPSMSNALLAFTLAKGSTNPSMEKMLGSSLLRMPSPSLSSFESRTPFPSVSGLFGSVPKNSSCRVLRSSPSASKAGGAPPTHHAPTIRGTDRTSRQRRTRALERQPRPHPLTAGRPASGRAPINHPATSGPEPRLLPQDRFTLPPPPLSSGGRRESKQTFDHRSRR